MPKRMFRDSGEVTMRKPQHGSVTAWVAQLKAGDAEAARQLWERYFARIVRLAQRRLKGASRRVADEEDVALSAFHSLCRGAANGHFTELSDRDDLWRLLAAIVHRKAVDHVRRNVSKKRGGGDVRGESIFGELSSDSSHEFAGFDAWVGDDPTPELLTAMDEEYQRLLGSLRNDTLRQIAMWRMEGESNEEIAQRLGTTVRSVERKLNRIREKWSQEGNDDSEAGV